MIRGRFAKTVACLCAFALIASVSAAAVVKVKVRNLVVPDVLPDVDAFGAPDFTDPKDALVKLTYNSRSGRLSIVARGNVINLSGARQTYPDVGLLTGNIPGDIIKDDYTVAKNGKAVYKGLAKNVPSPF